jgi:hypothetical protein
VGRKLTDSGPRTLACRGPHGLVGPHVPGRPPSRYISGVNPNRSHSRTTVDGASASATTHPPDSGLPAVDPARHLGLRVEGGGVEATHAVREVAVTGGDEAGATSMRGGGGGHLVCGSKVNRFQPMHISLQRPTRLGRPPSWHISGVNLAHHGGWRLRHCNHPPAGFRPPAVDLARRLGVRIGGGGVEATHAVREVAVTGGDEAGATSMRGGGGVEAREAWNCSCGWLPAAHYNGAGVGGSGRCR